MEGFVAKALKGFALASSDMKECENAVHSRAIAQLQEHLRHMVNNPTFSDVVFVCNDGERVHALRNLLAGRCDVLKGMLINGMAESNCSEIELPEFSSPVMLSVLEFLYTGSLVDDRPLSWTRACKTLKASRFFLLPFLTEIVRTFLDATTRSVARDSTKAAVLLTEALGYKGLWDEKDKSLSGLVAILSSDWSNSDFVNSLSEDALHYLLANSKCDSEGLDKLSFHEYFRFRQLIRWWVFHSDFGPSATEELVDFAVPVEERALGICTYQDESEIVSCPKDGTPLSNNWHAFRADEATKNAVARLMSNIDCRWIHPALLAKVVEPLEIVSSAEMVSAYRFHALRRPLVFKKPKLLWGHGESYCTLEQGYVIQRTGLVTEPAVLLAAMSRSVGVYHWRFVVEVVPEGYCELGFIYNTTSLKADLPTSARQRFSEQRCARVLDFRVEGTRMNWAEGGGCDRWRKLSQCICNRSSSSYYNDPVYSRAEFIFNAHDRLCSMILNGENCGIVWRDLPSAIYYPAVSLGRSAKGKVRIELVSGFDLL